MQTVIICGRLSDTVYASSNNAPQQKSRNLNDSRIFKWEIILMFLTIRASFLLALRVEMISRMILSFTSSQDSTKLHTVFLAQSFSKSGVMSYRMG